MKRISKWLLIWGALALLENNAHAVVTTGAGGKGVTVGSSGLIGQLEYSDTFTGTPDGGLAGRPYVAAAIVANVENTYGNPTGQTWGGATFSFASDRSPTQPGLVPGTPTYPGLPAQNTSGSGSLTGFTQTGGGVDYGTSASHPNQFVAQFDAIQVGDRIDITTSNTVGSIGGSAPLAVFFRKTGSANEIGLYNGAVETPTGLTSGVTGGTWNNYAVKYDRVGGTIEVFTNETSRGVINLNTFAGGIYKNYGTTVVNFGAGLGGGENRTWTDNAQIGRPVGYVSPYAVQPSSSSLVSYWNFNEANSGSSTAFDGQHANNGTALHTTGLQGLGAAAVNGNVANSVNVGFGGGNNFSTPNGITISAAFTLPNSYTGATGEIFRKDDGGNRILLSFQSSVDNAFGQLVGTAGVPGISLGLNTGGYKEMDVALDGLAGRPSLASLADGKVHYVSATYDAATGIKAMMIDGALIAFIDGADNVPLVDGGAANAFIGSLGGGAEPFAGVLDSVSLYNSALPFQLLATQSGFARAGLDPVGLPEPSTWCVGGLVFLVGIGYAWKRRGMVRAAAAA